MDALEAQQAAYPELAAYMVEFQELSSRRLWHQLMVKLHEFVNADDTNMGDNYLKLYTEWLKPLSTKFNQLELAKLLAKISTQFYPSRPYDADQVTRALDMLSEAGSDREAVGDAAWCFYQSEIAGLHVRAGNVKQAWTLLEELSPQVQALEHADPAVRATYYLVRAEYHQSEGPAHKFYDAALKHLSYVDLDTMSPEEAAELGRDVALSALVGDGIYNFGEIVEHPVVAALAETPQGWLSDLLMAFHRGDVASFHRLVEEHREAIDAQPALVANTEIVKQKAALMCLVNLAASKPASERSLTFGEIAEAVGFDLGDVEWLIMRAMSVGLIKGAMDGCAGVVHVSFVKPRVLDKTQVAELREALAHWGDTVHGTMLDVEASTEAMLS
jgi:26S proteasome regulatory subunit N9